MPETTCNARLAACTMLDAWLCYLWFLAKVWTWFDASGALLKVVFRKILMRNLVGGDLSGS